MPLTDEEILGKVDDFYEISDSGDANLRQRTIRAFEFINGEQWDHPIRTGREDSGKFVLTINLILHVVKHLAGVEIQNPRDIKVNPNRGGSKLFARILTALAKHATDSELTKYEQSQWFEAGAGSGQGYIGIELDNTNDPRHKDIEIEKLNQFYCRRDPNCTVYDMNARKGAEFFIYEPWESREWIMKKWENGEDAISSGTGAGPVGTAESVINWLVNAGKKVVSMFGLLGSDSDTLSQRREQVRYTYWREWEEAVYSYDAKQSELDALILVLGTKIMQGGKEIEVTTRHINNAKKIAKEQPDRYSIETVLMPVLHRAVTINETLMEHVVDELGLAKTGLFMYPIVPFYPYFDNGYIFGVAENLISLQEEVNWTRSEFLNIVKQLANNGWITGNDQYNDFLEKHSGENGVILDRSKCGNFLEKIEPNLPPSGLAMDAAVAKEDIKTVSNVRTEDPNSRSDESGRAIALKQQAAAVGSAAMFGNYEHSRVIFANLIVETIRHSGVYSEDEIREIIQKADLVDNELLQRAVSVLTEQGQPPPKPPQVQDPRNEPTFAQATPEAQTQAASNAVENFQRAQQEYQQKAQQYQEVVVRLAEKMIFAELKNIKRGRYNSTVSLSTTSPTIRMAEYAEVLDLHKFLVESGQPGIDRADLIKASNVSNPEELIANVPQAAGVK